MSAWFRILTTSRFGQCGSARPRLRPLMSPESSGTSEMRDREVTPYVRQPIERILQDCPTLPQQSCGVKRVTATVGLSRKLFFDLFTIAPFKIPSFPWRFSMRGEIVLIRALV